VQSQAPANDPHLDAVLPLTARSLAHDMAAVTASATCNQIVRAFHDDLRLHSLPVVDSGNRIIGVLRALDILRRGTEGFFHELHGRHSCTRIMDPNPLVFEASETLLNMSKAVAQLDDRHLVDGFFVTEGGMYLGAGRMTELIKAVTEQQLTTARYANPLTQLPGNVPIDQTIQQMLRTKATFAVAYFDLDNFKAFNDVYGYRAGDEVIRLTGCILQSIADESTDFIGHIGGDDFVAVFLSPDWEARVQRSLTLFDQAVLQHLRSEHIEAGGLSTKNRQGVEVFHGLVCLSVGIVRIAPGDFALTSEISSRLAEAKKMAKQMSGSSFFVDRRAHE